MGFCGCAGQVAFPLQEELLRKGLHVSCKSDKICICFGTFSFLSSLSFCEVSPLFFLQCFIHSHFSVLNTDFNIFPLFFLLICCMSRSFAPANTTYFLSFVSFSSSAVEYCR